MQCTQYHHPLLHKKNTNVRASIGSIAENLDALLPVVCASIGHGDGFDKYGNALLDSGIQISLICLETAESLG